MRIEVVELIRILAIAATKDHDDALPVAVSRSDKTITVFLGENAWKEFEKLKSGSEEG